MQLKKLRLLRFESCRLYGRGTIVQFGIPRVVIGENKTFGGNELFLRQHGVEVIIADDADCIALMERFILEKPELWAEDIAED